MDWLLCPRVIGREEELRTLHGVVASGATGRGQALAVLGEAGLGKSRLVAEALSAARETGLTVLRGRVREGLPGTAVPALREAVAGGLRRCGWPDDAALRPIRSLLGHLAGEPVRPPEGGLTPIALAEAILRLLRVLADRSGALLVLEDLHWADEDTLMVAEYLVANAEDHGAACLLTLRPEPGAEALAVTRRLADLRALQTVTLQPLTRAQVDQMVLTCLDADAAPADLLDFVHERADGVPFYVEELLAGLRRSGALVSADGSWTVVTRRLHATVPPTVAESVARRFAAVHPRTQRVLAAAALLGRRFDWALLGPAVELSDDAVLACLREASYAQFVEPDDDAAPGALRFRHALTREHIVARLLAPDRVALAARLRDVMVDRHPELPGSLCELAASLSDTAGHWSQAAALFAEAGRRARREGALGTAMARLEHALDLTTTGGPDTLRLRSELVELRALTGDVEAALELGTAALAELGAPVDDEARQSLELSVSRALLVAGRSAEARERAERVRVRAVPPAAHVAAVLTAQADVLRGDVDEAVDRARAVLSATGAGLPGETVCEAWEVIGQVARLHDVDAAERAFTAALHAADRYALDGWRARALHELGTIDLLDTMRTDRLEAARRQAVRAGLPATVAVVDFHLAEALVARGRIGPGRAAAERAIGLARRLGSSIHAPALVTLARSYAHEVRESEMEEVVARALRVAGDDPAVHAGVWGRARAMLALHRADRAALRDALDRAVDLLEALPAHHFPHRGLWALLRVVTGDDPGGDARRAAAAAAGSGTRFNRCLVLAATAVASGTSDPDAATRDFDLAVADLCGYQDADWLLHAVRWLVAPCAGRDGWGEPIVWLQEAVRWFADHRQRHLATAARTALRDLGAPVPRRGRGSSAVPDDLLASGVSSREMDVLRLIGERATNRGIAAALVLSPRTVEKHVASLLRKTGASDRAQLAALAADLPPDGAPRFPSDGATRFPPVGHGRRR